MDSDKIILYIAIAIGGFAGTYIPTLFGIDALSGWSLFWSTVGSIVGIWVWAKFLRS
jgi:uncharacterized membrane protein YeaQ/YmgE (transglycosylase-associated protein family)